MRFCYPLRIARDTYHKITWGNVGFAAAASIFTADSATSWHLSKALNFIGVAPMQLHLSIPTGWNVDWQRLWPVRIQESPNLGFCCRFNRNSQIRPKEWFRGIWLSVWSLRKVTFSNGRREGSVLYIHIFCDVTLKWGSYCNVRLALCQTEGAKAGNQSVVALQPRQAPF